MITQEQKDHIKANYSRKGAQALAAELGLSVTTIRNYAFEYRLRLDPSVRSAIVRSSRTDATKARQSEGLRRSHAERRALKKRCPTLVARDTAAYSQPAIGTPSAVPIPGALQDNKYYRGLSDDQCQAAIHSLDDSIRPGMTAAQIADVVRCRSMLSRHQSDASASFSVSALNFT